MYTYARARFGRGDRTMQTVLRSNQVFIGRYLIFYSAIRFHLGRIALRNSIGLIFFSTIDDSFN